MVELLQTINDDGNYEGECVILFNKFSDLLNQLSNNQTIHLNN